MKVLSCVLPLLCKLVYFFVALALALICCPIHLVAAPLQVDITADAAILINAETGAILYEKNSQEQYYPASITKIATALYALHKKESHLADLVVAEPETIASVTAEQKIKSNYSLPAYWLEGGGSHIGIKAGEKLSLEDLFYGLMIASGNDAANVIARYVSGSIPLFMDELNGYLKSLGCRSTYFLNPHGLHHPDHKTTAYDMALITREALKNPFFCKVVSTVRYMRPKTNKQEATTLLQTNKLLRSGANFYPKAIGVKTGSHSKALNAFVGAARDNHRTLIAVLLHAKERNDLFKDSVLLFEEAFKQTKVHRILMRAGPQKYQLELKEATSAIPAYIKEDVAIDYYPAEEPSLKAFLVWQQKSLPIVRDQKIGEVQIVTLEGKPLITVPLLAQQEVAAKWFYQVKELASSLSLWPLWAKWLLLLLAILLLLLTFLFFKRG